MKEVYILRGLPGSGKTKLAESLITNVDGVICSADDFMYVNGVYSWTDARACYSHHACKDLFIKSLDENKERIVLSNTNYRLADVKYYGELAVHYGYTVFVLIVENHHGGVNSHGVDDKKLAEMKNAILSNMKLI